MHCVCYNNNYKALDIKCYNTRKGTIYTCLGHEDSLWYDEVQETYREEYREDILCDRYVTELEMRKRAVQKKWDQPLTFIPETMVMEDHDDAWRTMHTVIHKYTREKLRQNLIYHIKGQSHQIQVYLTFGVTDPLKNGSRRMMK